MKSIKPSIALVFILMCGFASAQGRINGRVMDQNGEPLYGVVIRTVENEKIVAQADFDGLFVLNLPDTSTYTIKFFMISYEEMTERISLKNGETLNRDFILPEKSIMTSDVIITAKMNRAADTYMEKMKMNSTLTLDYISSETIKKTGDANVVNAIARVSGVSTNGGIITVRGIGDRYVKTTLNGSRIPTLDPLTNNIKLDIFPSSLIDNIIITKTASPENPGDWAGAYISVETKDYPDDLTINVETQFGYNPQSTFKDFITSERSSTDWLGYDDGLRTRSGNALDQPNINPSSYQQLVALGLADYFHSLGITEWVDGGSNSDTYFKLGLIQLGLMTSSQMNDQAAYQQALAEYNATYKPLAYRYINPANKDYNNGFSHNWTTKFMKAPMSYTQNLSIGNQVTFLGKQLGYFVGFRYGNSYRYDAHGISQRVLNEAYNYAIDTQDETLISRETNSWSGLLNLAYKLNNDHKVSFLFMPNITGTNDVASYTNIPFPVPDQTLVARRNMFYEQRKQLIYQVTSNNYIPAIRLRADFNASYTAGASIAPDFRTSQYFIELHADTIAGYQFYPTVGEGIRRFYRYLNENILDARLNCELPFGKEKNKDNYKIGFGAATQRTYRKSDNEEYQVMLGNNDFIAPITSDDLDSYLSPDHFIMTDSIIDYYYQYNNFDRNHNFGYSNIDAGYLMLTCDVTKKLQFSGGARAEHTDIFTDIDKFDRLGYEENDPRRSNLPNFPNVNPGKINQWNILPSGSLIYKLHDNEKLRSNLRINYSETLARPSIRELNDAANIDNEYRTFIYGNSDLQLAQIENYDFRAEAYFPKGDHISLSLFYKDFHNHIEMGFGNIGITWENIEKSNVQGIEIEGHKKLGNHIEFRSNVTLVKSVSQFIRSDFRLVEGEKVYTPIDTLNRPMYGQAPYIINAMLSYKSDTLGLSATVSYNVQGPRLVITGTIKGVPDVYEIERHLIDFKISKKIGKHFSLSLTARDLLNAPVRRAYLLPSGWFDYDKFRYGTSYILGVAYKL
ncbi:MAG: carboxypeptidase-like regulatory domain-containing protein [Flavobacteriales bacterium]|nr:carboxypeptidase-like regulatory domain-containing protein [Flavobacteriales bacterium]